VRSSTIITIGFAVVFGLIAVFVAQSWLNNQADLRMRSLEAMQKPPAATQTIVVAAKPLRFGNDLNAMSLREISWPQDAIPVGAFNTIADLTASGRRTVLTGIEANEPVLSTKVTGPGQRATLSAALAEGMKAVTIRVNDVEGVAGFVLPGDRVDVTLTRQNDKNAATSDVVLQNTKVLAIDQIADDRTDKPSIVKAVTLEVDTAAAQKLSLAASIGTLSLMLRKAGETISETTRRITLSDLVNGHAPVQQDIRFATVGVRRAAKRDDYSVPTEQQSPTLASSERRRAVR
jgi:pilus assembly protein CpaB